MGEKFELTATVRDAKGAAISDATFECKIDREGPNGVAEPVELYNQGDQSRATRYATEHLGVPGNYTATAIARRGAVEIGRERPASWSTRMTASWKILPPTSDSRKRSPSSPEERW